MKTHLLSRFFVVFFFFGLTLVAIEEARAQNNANLVKQAAQAMGVPVSSTAAESPSDNSKSQASSSATIADSSAVTTSSQSDSENPADQIKPIKALSDFYEKAEKYISRLVQWNHSLNWGLLLLSIFGGLVLGKFCSFLLQSIAKKRSEMVGKWFLDMAGPANLAFTTLGIFVGQSFIAKDEEIRIGISKVLILFFSISLYWYVYNLCSIVDIFFRELSRRRDSALDKHISLIVRRTLRIFVLSYAVLSIIEIFGGDVNKWLAGLGIAGIAVSLASQDSLKNCFGCLTIIFSHPFKIGDKIICMGTEGTVEDITFRATVVRTSAGHLLNIPNANLVNGTIENISRRPSIRRSLNLTLLAETDANKIRAALQILDDILREPAIFHPINGLVHGESKPPQILFTDFTAGCPTINVTYHYTPPKGDEYQQHAHRLNMRIKEEFDKAGIQLAAGEIIDGHTPAFVFVKYSPSRGKGSGVEREKIEKISIDELLEEYRYENEREPDVNPEIVKHYS